MEIYLGRNLRFLRKQKGLNQQDLADLVGKGDTTIGNWEKGISEPNFTELATISNYFGVSVSDVLYQDLANAHLIGTKDEIKNSGKSVPKGTPIRTPNTVNEPNMALWNRPPKVVTVDSAGNDNIVLVPLRARAGYLAGFEDPEFIQTLPSYRLPGLSHGTFRMFEVYGQSMVPTFHESDTIICRCVENLLEMRDDRIYVVITHREGVVVKRVVNRVQKDGKLILNSDNQRHAGEYPPIVINPEEIMEVWYAVAFMSRQMRAPGELYNRLIEVESRLTLLEDDHRKLIRK